MFSLDRDFVKDLQKANGDGSREAKFELWNDVCDARDLMSDPEAEYRLNTCLSKYGRAVTAFVIASTLFHRRERLGGWGLLWAQEVLKHWTNRSPSFVQRACIDDWFYHPTKICDYSSAFIRITSIDGQ